MAEINNGLPPAQGLYDPNNEHDACGVGFVVNMKGKRSHQTIRDALKILVNLLHRGACGCEANTGDGAGILIQIPHRFFQRECPKDGYSPGFSIPEPGHYGMGCVMMPPAEDQRIECERLIGEIVREEGQTLMGWRDVPQNNSLLG